MSFFVVVVVFEKWKVKLEIRKSGPNVKIKIKIQEIQKCSQLWHCADRSEFLNSVYLHVVEHLGMNNTILLRVKEAQLQTLSK